MVNGRFNLLLTVLFLLASIPAALAFTLAQPVTAAVCPSHAELLWLACDALEALGKSLVADPLHCDIDGEPLFRTENAVNTAQ